MKKITAALCLVFICLFLCFTDGRAAGYDVYDGIDFHNALYNVSASTDASNYLYFADSTIEAYDSFSPVLSNENIYFYNEAVIDFKNQYYMANTSGGMLNFDSAATLKNAYKNGNGGVVSSNASALRFSDYAAFENNTAGDGSGGALYLANDSEAFFYGNNFFSNNYAYTSGGSIYMNHSYAAFYESAYLYGNTASSGGAIAAENGSNLNFYYDVDFSGNNANNNGGGIFADASVLYFDSYTSFDGNYASNSGGGLYAGSGSDVTFGGDLYFTSNRAELHGGGLYALGTELYFSYNADFSANVSDSHGGAFFLSDSAADFDGNAYIDGNTASGYGGGFYLEESSVVNFNGSLTLSGNKAVHGGGFYGERGTSGSFSGENLNILNNEAGLYGGGFYNDGATYNFDVNTVISGNKAALFGGGFFSNNGGVNKFLKSAVFKNNSAAVGGAVVLMGNSRLDLRDAVFSNNYAHALGGAVFLQGTNSSNMAVLSVNTDSYTLFSGNKAAGVSNAVHIGDNASAVFNTAASASVEMYDDITSGSENSSFLNMGAGSFYAIGNNMSFHNYTNQGNFYMRNASMTVGSAFVNSGGAVFDMSVPGKVTAADFTNAGKLVFGIYNDETNAQIYADKITLENTSSLEAKAQDITSSSFRQKVYYLASYGYLSGEFADFSVTGLGALDSITAYIDYGVNYDNWIKLFVKGALEKSELQNTPDLSFNESEAAKAYDAVSANAAGDLNTVIATIETLPTEYEIKSALSGTSGYFLANVIAASAADFEAGAVYDKTGIFSENQISNAKGLWLQYFAGKTAFGGNDNSPGEYRSANNGVTGGFDRYFDDKDIMLGVFMQYKTRDITQQNNSASVTGAGGGIYGGLIKENWEIKALADFNADSYETKRKISFSGVNRTAEGDFNGFNGGLDILAALKTRISSSLTLKPYIGMENRIVSYSDFEESGADSLNLSVESGNYFRTSARAGISVGSGTEKYLWYAGAEGKYLLAGEEPEIDLRFTDTDAGFKSRGAEQSKVILGLFIGGSYNFYKNFDVYAGLGAGTSDSSDSFYGNIGLRYAFTHRSGGTYVSKKEPGAERTGKSISGEAKISRAENKSALKSALAAEKKKEKESEREVDAQSKAAAKKIANEQKMRESELKKQETQELKRIKQQEELKKKEEQAYAEASRKIIEEQQRQEIEAQEAQKRARHEAEKMRKAQIEAEIAAFEAQLAAEQKSKENAAAGQQIKDKNSDKKQTEESGNQAGVEEKRESDDKAVIEYEMKKQAEEERILAEAKKKADEEAKAADLIKKQEGEAEKQAALEAKRKAKEEAEIRKQAKEEEKRILAEAKKKADEKAKAADLIKKQEEEAEKQAALEEKRKAEEKAAIEAEIRKQVKEEEKRILAEAKKKADEEAKAADLIKKQEEEAKKQAALEEKRKAEEKAAAEAEIRKQAKEEEKRILAEAKKKADEEAKAADLIKKQEEEAKKQAVLEEKRKAEEKAAAEAEIRKQAKEEEKRILAEAKKKADEEAKAADLIKKQEEEAKKQAALEEKRKAEEKAAAEAEIMKQANSEANVKTESEAKGEALAKKQAEEAEKEKARKEQAELKAKKAAEEKVRKEEEMEKRQRKRDEAAAKKAAEKQRLSQKAKEKAEYEAAQKAAAEEADKIKKDDFAAVEPAVPALETSAPDSAAAEDKESSEQKESLKLKFVLPQSNLFASSTQFELTSDGVREVWKAIDAILAYIEGNPSVKFKVYVDGYADSSGSAEINKQYSLRRAAVIANELADSDISDDLIEPRGMGATNFINKNNTLAAENRRVEIKLVVVGQ